MLANTTTKLGLVLAAAIALAGCDAATTATNEMTAQVHPALDSGNNARLQRVLDEGADPNVKDKTRMSALAKAVQRRNPEAVKVLLEAGANPNTDRLGDNPARSLLSHAAHLAGNDRGKFAADGSWVVINGQDWVNIAKHLIAAGADPNVRDRNCKCRGERCLKGLKRYGETPEERRMRETCPTALDHVNGNPELKRLMFAAGADPEKTRRSFRERAEAQSNERFERQREARLGAAQGAAQLGEFVAGMAGSLAANQQAQTEQLSQQVAARAEQERQARLKAERERQARAERERQRQAERERARLAQAERDRQQAERQRQQAERDRQQAQQAQLNAQAAERERQARLQAEAQAQAERQARLQAEAQAKAAE